MGRATYLTDVEGLWHKIEDFCAGNPWVSLDGERLALADGATFVFGGDAIDRGPWSRRVVDTLLDAKRRYGDRVVLLAGNRDINKMRLVRELCGHPPARAPREVVDQGRVALLKWIFQNTMGAGRAFEMRYRELSHGGAAASEEDVVESFLGDLGEGGVLSEYLASCQLAHRDDRTLFVHGAVTDASLGTVPGRASRIGDPDEWIAALNEFYREQMAAFLERRTGKEGAPLWAPLVAYQAPVPGTRLNQASVVYGRPADALGNPQLPRRDVIAELSKAGIERVVVGHTPSGDSPSVLCDEGFQLVIADSSYGRIERGTQLFVEGSQLRAAARARLDSGEERAVSVDLQGFDARGPVGLRDPATGRLVKGELSSGDYLVFRFVESYKVEQAALSPKECAALSLVVPRQDREA
jgi:hypothetical protein